MSAGISLRAAIIGCGRIGWRRARTMSRCDVVACVDSDVAQAQKLAGTIPRCIATSELSQVLGRDDIDLVIICTTHNALGSIALAAVQARKHVLVEKPGALRSSELDPLIVAAHLNSVRVRVGFNHRYHRALQKARQVVDAGLIGPLMFVRGRYGHGGRVGYEKEWRARPELSGGGELIDQGIHLIDLARWFLGDFSQVQGLATTCFWDMPVDDNGFMLLQTKQRQVAFLHASCTEWKNLFSFEIYGRIGKLDIFGLGGSYGLERIAFYKMSPELGPPETTIWEYPMADNSWELEFSEFVDDILLNREPQVGLADARAALRVVEAIYQVSAS